MGKVRTFAPHVKWSESEIMVLTSIYESAESIMDVMARLPGRKVDVIQGKANALGLTRVKAIARTPNEVREAKRESMARRRAANPEAARAYHRERHHKNHEMNKAKMRAYAARRFFWVREMHLRGDGRATAKELARMWREQRGRCALTGRRLTRDNSHLDHIVPIAKGGGHAITNLRWLCVEANLAKRALSDEVFTKLCGDVMAWIGRRIEMVDALQ